MSWDLHVRYVIDAPGRRWEGAFIATDHPGVHVDGATRTVMHGDLPAAVFDGLIVDHALSEGSCLLTVRAFEPDGDGQRPLFSVRLRLGVHPSPVARTEAGPYTLHWWRTPLPRPDAEEA